MSLEVSVFICSSRSLSLLATAVFGNDRRGSPTTAQDWGLSRNMNVLYVSCVDALLTAMCVVVAVCDMCCVLRISVFELPPLRTNKSARIYRTVEQGSSSCNIFQRHYVALVELS